MNFNQEYTRLATLLGDVEFKLALYTEQKQTILSQIKEIDKLAGLAKQKVQKNEAANPTAQSDTAGSNSPS